MGQAPGVCNHVTALTHWGPVAHICISKLGHHWFRKQLVAWLAPSHYLNQCWYIVELTIRQKFSEITIEIVTFLFKKMHLKMSSAKQHPFCIGLKVVATKLPQLFLLSPKLCYIINVAFCIWFELLQAARLHYYTGLGQAFCHGNRGFRWSRAIRGWPMAAAECVTLMLR